MAIADAFPLDGETALTAVYDSSGWAEDVNDEEILKSQQELGRTEGIFAESASAATYAAVAKMRAKGKIKANESVVCVITGNGVKELPQIEKNMKRPEVIDCSVEALKKYLVEKFQI